MGYSLAHRLSKISYPPAERVFRTIERHHFSRGSTLLDIPPYNFRLGNLGTVTYGEWCYTIGQFQTLIFMNIMSRPLHMLDIGCGVGRMYLAAKPYIQADDTFVGIDISEKSIDTCKKFYADERLSFVHTAGSNAYYADNDIKNAKWPIESASKNLITALSVWTHLKESDFRLYLNEVGRVLRPGGRAIVSFFVLDALYKPEHKTAATSRFYPQPEDTWIFDESAYESPDWMFPSWAEVPEVAIAVREAAFHEALDCAGLKIVSFYPGQWKDQPGLFFQDIAVLTKK
jgi:SAM-dependent methyltransferase